MQESFVVDMAGTDKESAGYTLHNQFLLETRKKLSCTGKLRIHRKSILNMMMDLLISGSFMAEWVDKGQTVNQWYNKSWPVLSVKLFIADCSRIFDKHHATFTYFHKWKTSQKDFCLWMRWNLAIDSIANSVKINTFLTYVVLFDQAAA